MVRTTKFKVMTKKFSSSCNQEKREGIQQSRSRPGGSQPRGSVAVATKREKGGPQRSKSRPRGLLTIAAKKKEKEDDDQGCNHEDH